MFYRIYVTSGVDGIGKHDKQAIDCEFQDNGVDLRVLSFNGKNWRLKISPLNNLIEPGASKLKVKSNSITLELKKANKKYWTDIKEKKKTTSETSASSTKKSDEPEAGDPGASLMNMMKELYENGDENMKRTIAESWTKAQ